MEKIMRTLGMAVLAALSFLVIAVAVQSAQIASAPMHKVQDPAFDRQVQRMTTGAALLD